VQRSTEICVNSTARNLQEQLVEAFAGLSGREQGHVAHLLLFEVLVALQQLCTSHITMRVSKHYSSYAGRRALRKH
jgi:hypothetical protein